MIGSGATAGAALVDYSGLTTGTAAEHLLVDVTTETPAQPSIQPIGGASWIAPPNNYPPPKKKQDGVEVDHRKLAMIAMQRAEEEVVLQIIIVAVTRELLH
ncbi:MAG: hypothetical protein A2143_09280 [Gallionellales bacterium RBG_16_57_15]|nr:MAG: hypothetical protein A2143_09280 [Gallionellales bacterium RBG_16_57_15]